MELGCGISIVKCIHKMQLVPAPSPNIQAELASPPPPSNIRAELATTNIIDKLI